MVGMRDRLGAFCRHARIDMAGAENGPLSGLSFAAKDLFDVEGVVTGAGNPTWLATHDPARRTASAVQRLLEAGGRLVGKTIMDELAFSLIGENHHYGTPINPQTPQRVPGGSSSGSASAVAGGLVDFALGTDTAGSIRVPAAFCGLFGFRPTHGRIAMDGVVPLAPGFDTIGWLARDAGTLARVGAALFGPLDRSLQPRHVLVVEDAFAIADPVVRTALGPAVDAVTAALGPPRDIALSPNGLEAWALYFSTLQGFEIWRTHGAWITAHKPHFGPGVAERFAWTSSLSESAAAPAQAFQADVTETLTELLGNGDLLLLPTIPGIAPLKGTPPSALDPFRRRMLSLTCIASLAGLPEVTLPLAEVDGCPVGLSLIARRGGDAMLLAAAAHAAAAAL